MSKRSRILVDPQVQWSIAARIVAHWGLLLLCLITLGSMVRILASVGDKSLSEALIDAARSQTPVLAVMLFLIPVFVRDTLKLSNRLAGPLFRLRTAFTSMAQGDSVAHKKFRDGYFWKEAAVDFNTVLSQYEDLKARNAELEAELSELREEEVDL